MDEAEWPEQLLLLRDFSSALSAKLKGFPSFCQKHRSKGVQWWEGTRGRPLSPLRTWADTHKPVPEGKPTSQDGCLLPCCQHCVTLGKEGSYWLPRLSAPPSLYPRGKAQRIGNYYFPNYYCFPPLQVPFTLWEQYPFVWTLMTGVPASGSLEGEVNVRVWGCDTHRVCLHRRSLDWSQGQSKSLVLLVISVCHWSLGLSAIFLETSVPWEPSGGKNVRLERRRGKMRERST